ncbi:MULTISPECIES: LexA family protein [Streptomyces]|uniref:LexA family protein n=1 Tax=Streptomyces TaxID=1883 RepID=UPI000A400CD7|nr:MULTISPECIES: S24 family peptidase [Streptomyces]
MAALIDGEATVKRLKRDGSTVWLMPENEAYADPWRCGLHPRHGRGGCAACEHTCRGFRQVNE